MSMARRLAGAPPGCDRIYPLSRAVAIFVIPFVVAAFVVLYLTTENNGDNFAWHVQPSITAMIMGAGYLAGGWFFLRLALGKRWHEHGTPLPAVFVFTETLFIATLLHWERFNNDHRAFYIWVVLYAIAPPLVLLAWWLNRAQDPGLTADPGPRVPLVVRRLLTVTGIALVAIMVWLLVHPDSAIDAWPWAMTELAARTMSGWFALGGVAAILLGREPRWSCWRVPLEATLVWCVLTSIAVLRARDVIDWDDPAAWVFALGVYGSTAATVALIVYMESRRHHPIAAPAVAAS